MALSVSRPDATPVLLDDDLSQSALEGSHDATLYRDSPVERLGGRP
jgi:hypothetical protein